jgi:hypothetical protein
MGSSSATSSPRRRVKKPHVFAALISVVAYLSFASASLALPGSVATPIQRARAALTKTQDQLALHRYGRALDSLQVLRRNVVKANKAATEQIGLPRRIPSQTTRLGRRPFSLHSSSTIESRCVSFRALTR